jgi:hypothetical protein
MATPKKTAAPKPTDVKLPQDHAAKAEAKSQDVKFAYDGVHYVIDRDNADNLELMEFVEDEQYIKAIRGYLGLDQWAKFKDSHRDDKGRVSTDAFDPFLNAVMAAVGGGSKESPNFSASPTS